MRHEATGNGIQPKAFGLALCAMLFALCSSVQAQQTRKIPRIGYVSASGDHNNPGPRIAAFRQGLRDLGYVESKNILLEYRYAEGNVKRIPSLVTELVELRVDVLVTQAMVAIRAAKQATKTIPIVMVATVDPVATGLVDSLAHPGGNITGLTTLSRDLSGKRLELLKEVAPSTSTVGLLQDADAPVSKVASKEYEAAAPGLKVKLQALEVRGPNPDLEGAFQTARKEHVAAFISITNPRY